MKNLGNHIIAIILLSCLCKPANSQSTDECKYLSAITYLRTDSSINAKIKLLFPKIARKHDEYVSFNLSDKITFLSISSFKDQLKEKNYFSNKEILSDANLFLKTYFFMPFESGFLKKLKWHNEAKIFLSFSRPVQNFLIAELTEFDPKLFGGRKYGRAMQFFFKFDLSGIVEDALYSGCVYN